MTRILVIDGHPDPDPARYVHALASAYVEGAQAAGHEVSRLNLSRMEVPLLRARRDWEGAAPPDIAATQEAISAAQHLVILYPLWLGDVPALLKAFLEQVARPGFAFPRGAEGLNTGLLKGKSARVVVTMGMPGFVYRYFFLAHSLRSLKRNVLEFVGIRPVRMTVIGRVEGMGDEARRAWLGRLRTLGTTAG